MVSFVETFPSVTREQVLVLLLYGKDRTELEFAA